jgi:hypothetical protein
MPVQMQHGQVDFSQLADIGQNFGQMRRSQKMNEVLASSMKDGVFDYDAAVTSLMQGGFGEEALKLSIAKQQADSLNTYRSGMIADKVAPSLDERIYNDWMSGGQPNRLGPPDSIGASVDAADAEAAGLPSAPGSSYVKSPMNAPKIVQEKVLPIQVQKQLEQEGEKQGDRNAFRAALVESGPQVNQLISTMVGQVRDSDEGTFENAFGPLQGAMPSDDWRTTLTSGLPQTLGAVSNYLEKGVQEGFLKGEGANVEIKQPGDLGGGFTDTLRSKVQSTQASLVGIMQRMLRVPGIGAQSDYELRQIIAQAGELSKARTKADFQDRLQNVLGNMKAIGIPIDIPTLDQVAGPGGGKFADRLGSEAPPVASGPAPVEPPAASMIGEGADARRVTPAPPTPPKKAINALKAYMNDPRFREEAVQKFESIYGPGSVQLYLGLGGR